MTSHRTLFPNQSTAGCLPQALHGVLFTPDVVFSFLVVQINSYLFHIQLHHIRNESQFYSLTGVANPLKLIYVYIAITFQVKEYLNEILVLILRKRSGMMTC